MEKILNLIHKLCSLTMATLVFLCLDVPLKVLAVLFILIVGFLAALLAPIAKRTTLPNWIGTVYDYATTWDLLARHVYHLWVDGFNL
jgi:hypothetical protein